MMDDPPFDLQAYEPPLSLWSLVEQHISPYEQMEIKNMLGESLVDQSIELHAEIDTLLEIWRDYRYETDDMQPAKILPEPPGLRDRLIQEIQFFVENVKEKAQKQGVNPEKVLQTKYNMEVVDYALDSSRPGTGRPGSGRPCSAFSREGSFTPMITSPTGSDRTSYASTLSEEIESMNDKLNFLKFEEVVQHLRSTIEEEIETLLRDIRFLYECIDEEADFRAEKQGTLSREPTILDLQQERSKMEKELLESTTFKSPKKNFSKTMPPIQKLGPVSSPKIRIRNLDSPPVPVTKSSRDSPIDQQSSKKDNSPKHGPESPKHGPDSPKPGPKVSSSTRNQPMKASHDIKLVHQTNDSIQSSHSDSDKRNSPVDNQRKSAGIINFKGRRAVMTMKEGIGGAQIVTLDMPNDQGIKHVPSPPPPLERPSSAQRFRKMVMECRDT